MKETQTRGLKCPSSCSESAAGSREIVETSASNTLARKEPSFQQGENLMETILTRPNLIRALRQVESNKGSAGIDGMSVQELRPYLKSHWVEIRESLLQGRYKPQPVRQVKIPKAGGGQRELGIPTVLDRFIQQAIQQILSPIWEPEFSESSYGFRPGRSAHQAIKSAQSSIREGRNWVVDMDLSQFFDRVNHDRLMHKLSEKVKDKNLLKLIRNYLEAGVMAGGLVSIREKGTPQGSPLSPLLSNIVLNEWDQELEKRGHRFCRYADDSNIYVRSRRAGERVFRSLKRFLEHVLRLQVNETKSCVDKVWKRKFLGYSFSWKKAGVPKVSASAIQRLKERLKSLFRSGKGRNLSHFILKELNPYLRGWIQYFHLSEMRKAFEELDGWIRRKLRCIQWRQWKRPWTRFKALKRLGLKEEHARRSAWNGRGPWWNSGAAHMHLAMPKKHYDQLGLISLLDRHSLLRGT